MYWRHQKHQCFVFITEILWRTFPRIIWRPVFDVVKRLRFSCQYPLINYLRQKCSAAKRSKRAKSSLRSRISSSAVHWADNEVNPQISANKMLKKREKIRLKKYKSLFLYYKYRVSHHEVISIEYVDLRGRRIKNFYDV